MSWIISSHVQSVLGISRFRVLITFLSMNTALGQYTIGTANLALVSKQPMPYSVTVGIRFWFSGSASK